MMKYTNTHTHMMKLLRTPTVAFLTFLVGMTSLATTLQAQVRTGGGGSSGSNTTSAGAGICGNGVRENSEQCDDGNTDNNDECTMYCMKPRCGDGIVHQKLQEECDDSNGDDSDECTNVCRKARCGDGIVHQKMQEECDDRNGDDSDECTNVCRKARCGDGITSNQRGEQCDEGESNGKDGHCTKECKKPKVEEPPKCGNGVTEGNEECDDGNGDNADDCSDRCRKAFCGDSIVQNWEECDLGRSNGMYECDSYCRKRQYNSTPGGTTGDDGTITIGNPPPPPSSVSSSQPSRGNTTSQEDETWKRMMEEMKKRSEEDQKRMEAQMEEQRRMQGFMGCFNSSGMWTSNRSECDENQRKHLKEQIVEIDQNIRQKVKPVPVQTIPEEQVREEIRENLLGDNITEEHRKKLLSVLEEAKTRMTLLSKQELAPEVTDYLKRAIEWLDQGVVYFSSGVNAPEEIRLMNQPVRDLMKQVGDLIASQKQLPKELPKIDPIVEKTELLVNKFRNAFVLLAQNGIGLDQTSLQAYVDAAQHFAEVKPACVDRGLNCGDLNQVLEKLKLARPWLEDQLNAHPDIAKKVQ